MSSRWPHICNELNTLKYFIFSKWQRLTTSQSYFPDGVTNLLTLHFHHDPCLEKSVFNLSNTNRASALCPLMLDSAVPSQHILRILFRVNKLISSLINHTETFNDTFMFFKLLHKRIIYVFYEEMEDIHSSEISSSKSVSEKHLQSWLDPSLALSVLELWPRDTAAFIFHLGTC